MVGIKDISKLVGIIIISACAVFICTLFLNYNIDLKGMESLLTEQQMPLYDALLLTGRVVSAVSGGCLLLTSTVMLIFYVKHYIDSRRKDLGILKALGYSNIKIAVKFWVFGLSVLIGAGAGFGGAHCLMPLFYAVQNEDKFIPDFNAEFHIELFLYLVILPTLFFAGLSVIYGYCKMKTPVMQLLKGDTAVKVKYPAAGGGEGLPFLKDMRRAVIRGRKSLVFFIGFAAFCFSAMVQMSFGMGELASDMFAMMTLMIGVILALSVLFIAVTTVVSSNAKSVALMRGFGYTHRECSAAVLNGYRPAAVIGFAVGTFYQYFLLKLAVEVFFREVENVPEFEFDFRALIIAALVFVVVYEIVMLWYSRKIGKLSLKEVMLDSEC